MDLGSLEDLGGRFPMFNRSEGSFQALSELLTRLAGHTFNQLLHATIGSDRETNGALRHPTETVRRRC